MRRPLTSQIVRTKAFPAVSMRTSGARGLKIYHTFNDAGINHRKVYNRDMIELAYAYRQFNPCMRFVDIHTCHTTYSWSSHSNYTQKTI